MLDYDFLDKCTDPVLIRAIIRKLRSGDEGHYPHLVKVRIQAEPSEPCWSGCWPGNSVIWLEEYLPAAIAVINHR